MAHIAIVGAGITGVTTAYALLDCGYRAARFHITETIRSRPSVLRSRRGVDCLRSRSEKESILIWRGAAFFIFIVIVGVLTMRATSIPSYKGAA
jgi:hypothetical protein